MLTSKDRGSRRKKPLLAWSSTCSSTIVSILISFSLITGSFILMTPTLIAAALAQEENDTTSEGSAATTTEGSLQPDQNFSETPEFDEEEFSQPEEDLSPFLSSFMTEVNGTYMNPDIGFQINLPAGWKGIEINFLINSVFAAPGETNLDLLEEGEDFQEPATFMTIQGIDQESFNEVESLVSELPALEGGGVDGEEGTPLTGGGNPLGTTTSPFADNAVSCTFSQPSFVTINGINAEERVAECIDEEGGEELVAGVTNIKTKSYVFATQDNSLIALGFYGNSTSAYDQNLPLFEESVRTISISRPADITTSEIYNRYKELLEMEQQQLSNQTGGSGM